MKKLIRKFGDSLVISFNKEEQQVYDLAKGKVVNVYIKEVKNVN